MITMRQTCRWLCHQTHECASTGTSKHRAAFLSSSLSSGSSRISIPRCPHPFTLQRRSVFSWPWSKKETPAPSPASEEKLSDPLHKLSSAVIPSTSSRTNAASPPRLPLPPLFISRATRASSTAHHRSIRISPTKLNDICRLVRGLGVHEAIIQCKLCPKKKAVFVANCIKTAAHSGVVNFQMDPARLYVAEAIVGHGTHYKRQDIKARGRHGIKHVYHAHLTIIVKEQPTLLTDGPLQGSGGLTRAMMSRSHRAGIEVRIGRFGRKINTIERDKKLLEKYAEEKRKRGIKVPLPLERRRAVVMRP